MPEEGSYWIRWSDAKELGYGTPLDAAVKNGRLEAVKFLLEQGADASIKNSKGKTPVEVATEMEVDSSIVRLLSSPLPARLLIDTYVFL
jgi:hypothetical protein